MHALRRSESDCPHVRVSCRTRRVIKTRTHFITRPYYGNNARRVRYNNTGTSRLRVRPRVVGQFAMPRGSFALENRPFPFPPRTRAFRLPSATPLLAEPPAHATSPGLMVAYLFYTAAEPTLTGCS